MSVTSVSTAMYDFYSFFVVDQEARNQHMKIYTIAQEAFSSDKSFDSVMQLMGRALYVALDHIPVVSLVINEAAVFFWLRSMQDSSRYSRRTSCDGNFKINVSANEK